MQSPEGYGVSITNIKLICMLGYTSVPEAVSGCCSNSGDIETRDAIVPVLACEMRLCATKRLGSAE